MTAILIIEDDEILQENLIELLELEGFSTLSASDGIDGLRLIQDQPPDLILCDVMMPNLDGFGVLVELRSDPATSHIPFIFLTAKTDRINMRNAMTLGADDYITKPFTPPEVLSAIRTRLKRQASLVREYEQKLENLRENLISTLPHELRTPLTAILGYSQLLMMGIESYSPQEALESIKKINSAGQRLYQLIENYLLYAQLEVIGSDASRIAAIRSAVVENVGVLIADITQQKAYDYGRSDDLVMEIEDTTIQGTLDNIERIIDELVENAFKFSTAGSPVEVRALVDMDTYTIYISDAGRGMTAEQIKQIGAYMQFERKLHEQQGSGMGLIIAKRLTDLQGGTFHIESIPHQQTLISLSFPRVE